MRKKVSKVTKAVSGVVKPQADSYESLLVLYSEQVEINRKLTETVGKLTDEVSKLREQVAELTASKNKNSTNSHKPSSTDFFNKPKPSSINKGGKSSSPKKNLGGQVGHKGNTMKLKDEPDHIVRCIPSECASCPMASSCKAEIVKIDERNVVDVEIRTVQTRFDRMQRSCPCCNGKVLKGSYPDGVNTTLQYGDGIRSLVVALTARGMVSVSRTADIIRSLIGTEIAESTICNIISSTASKLKGCYEKIRNSIVSSILAHFDETGGRDDEGLIWVHAASTDSHTYLFAHKKRGNEGIDAAGVLPYFKGIAVHDFWTPYHKYGCIHAFCDAHIDRELQGVIDNTRQRWASRLQDLLERMYIQKEELLAKGISKAPEEMKASFFNEYDEIVEAGFRRNPPPKNAKGKRGRKKKGKVLSLLERLRTYKEEILRFFSDFSVPFSNNKAERACRMNKLKTKVSGCFRGKGGAENYAIIMSVMDTARKQGLNMFHTLSSILAGDDSVLAF